ncbi:MAG TPA: 3-isopropylmalate dehydrogenase [Alphaproteobacteria bacterium]|nr:3-isopropylmalate dehydrogenase [Alphaproteobacteria bacterium]
MTYNILLLPGDGIGPEVMAPVRRILLWLKDTKGAKFTLHEDDVGGAAYDRYGHSLAPHTLKAAMESDAVMLGAVGGPKWDKVDYSKRPEAALLALRKELELFANLRPAIVFDELVDASTLKPEVVKGLDILIVRELTGGVYFGEPRGIFDLGNGERKGVNTQVYTTPEIRRVARVAFELARLRGNKVCSCEKGNVMESGRLWREEVTALHARDYKDVELSHMYADAAAMMLLRRPKDFDVIVTDNLFGDILSDEAAMLTGSIGMLPSASLGAPDEKGRRRAMYEPCHGSAPDIAGQNKANPLATILSLGMALRYSLNMAKEADALEAAVKKVLAKGLRTVDIAGAGQKAIGTEEMGAAVLKVLAE